MFVFLFVISIKILVVLSMIENLSINDSEIERTTFAPMNLMSNELEKAVHSLQTAIHLLLPQKNSILNRPLQLIKCLSTNKQLNDEEKNICKEYLQNRHDISEDSIEQTKKTMFDTIFRPSLNQHSHVTNTNEINLNQTKHNHPNSLIEKLKTSFINMKNRARDNDGDSKEKNSNLGQMLSQTYQQNEFDTQNENTESNRLSATRWNLDRTRDISLEKNILLANLSQTLGTLESIIDTQTLLKPADIISIIKNQRFSWKFLRFLGTIKSILDRSVTKNQFGSTN